MRNCVISLACVVKDYQTGRLHEFYEECRPDTLVPNYEHPRLKGFIVHTWSEDAEKVHGFSWKQASSRQHPFDMAVKFLQFLKPFHTEGKKLPFIYHANAQFDWRMVKGLMHKSHDRLYFGFYKLFNDRYIYDTMAMARAYLKTQKTQLDIIQKNTEKLTKPRQRKANPKHVTKWEGEIQGAREALRDHKMLSGYSLDKLCRDLGIPLDHHNALSDAKALVPIWEFLATDKPESPRHPSQAAS